MKDQRLYLIHIKECIEKIGQYTENGELSFSNDPKTQDAVIGSPYKTVRVNNFNKLDIMFSGST